MAEAELPGIGDQLDVRVREISRLGDQVKGDVLGWDRKEERTRFNCDALVGVGDTAENGGLELRRPSDLSM